MKILGIIAENAGAILVAALAVLVFWFYTGNLKRDNEITKMSSTISELSNKNSVLEQRVESYKQMMKAAEDAAKEQQAGLKEQSKIETETLEALKNEILERKGANDAKTSNSDPLPDSSVRLLNDHCNKVRGSACQSP